MAYICRFVGQCARSGGRQSRDLRVCVGRFANDPTGEVESVANGLIGRTRGWWDERIFYIHHRLRDRLFRFLRMYEKVCVFRTNRTTQVLMTLGRPSNIVEVDAIAIMVGRKPYLEFLLAFFSIY
jgi:hypothetical protein